MKKGFSLLELLIVIAIMFVITILVIGLPCFKEENFVGTVVRKYEIVMGGSPHYRVEIIREGSEDIDVFESWDTKTHANLLPDHTYEIHYHNGYIVEIKKIR
jgi:hypothetical protein